MSATPAAEPMSRSEKQFRARVAEMLVVVLTSCEVSEELKAYVVETGQELKLLQVSR